jgi:tRNA(Ile2) C34 agmatinyltransferase TiaS
VFYSRHLHSKYNYKRIYRFGIYWYKHKPYCPYCGHKLEYIPGNNYFDCSCGERIVPCDSVKRFYPPLRDVFEIIKKET